MPWLFAGFVDRGSAFRPSFNTELAGQLQSSTPATDGYSVTVDSTDSRNKVCCGQFVERDTYPSPIKLAWLVGPAVDKSTSISQIVG